MMYSIEPINELYRDFINKQIAENWAGPFVVTRGVLHDTRYHHGFAAQKDGEILGYILYHFENNDCEISVLESLREKQGIGGALVKAVIQAAKAANCKRIWLVTTNDNTNAIRFYQRIGFSLCAVRLNALEESRKLKSQIPLIGNDGIPIVHEFEFEWVLD